jgi:hypothetical protein
MRWFADDTLNSERELASPDQAPQRGLMLIWSNPASSTLDDSPLVTRYSVMFAEWIRLSKNSWAITTVRSLDSG